VVRRDNTKASIVYVCKYCDSTKYKYITKEEHTETIPCDKCDGGMMVDVWYLSRYKSNKQPLLTIEVMDMNSIPKVIYKGEDVTGKVSINYEWMTKGNTSGKHSYELEYFNGKDDETVTLKKVSEKKE
jgi:hypothetical protein